MVRTRHPPILLIDPPLPFHGLRQPASCRFLHRHHTAPSVSGLIRPGSARRAHEGERAGHWGVRRTGSLFKERTVKPDRVHASGEEFPPNHAGNANDVEHRTKITRSRSRPAQCFNGNRQASMSCTCGLDQNFAFENETPDFSMFDLHTTQQRCGIDTKARLTICK